MDLEHSFSVPVGVDEAWKILLDYERVARLLPGATVRSADGDSLTGAFKVKLGPVNLNYQGSATVEKDELAHRAVLTASGTDARNGDGSATVTAALKDEGESTTVLVTTSLELTGKPAQFGHAVMADVGAKLVGQFAEALAAELGAGPPEPAEAADPAPAYATPPAAAAEPADEAPPAAAPVEDATPAYSVPGGGVSADEVEPATAPMVNDRPPAERAVARDLSDVEPIELIKSAGPALGKRIAGPAAVALVIALIAARRRQRR